MPIGIEVHDLDMAPGVLEDAFDWLRHVDDVFSTYKSESEVMRFNRAELDASQLTAEVVEVLDRCEQLRQETGGYFDIRRPDGEGVDPSGYVKGWSVDRAAEILRKGGASNFCVNAGGDVIVAGSPQGERDWKVGIQHPLERGMLAAVVVGSDLSIATSGAYERGAHIHNPLTGKSPSGLLSVTITGPELGTADAFATAAFAMGRDAVDWVAHLVAWDAMVIEEDQTVTMTPGFPDERVFGEPPTPENSVAP